MTPIETIYLALKNGSDWRIDMVLKKALKIDSPSRDREFLGHWENV